jgi:anion-transporting  ArsA/GET3 family ATPase
MDAPLRAATREASVLIAVGAGGVGKTSVAAALALGAAMEGRASLVLTIDPARRLADALGLGALDNQDRAIPDDAFQRAGLLPRAPMRAMMLDMKRTWDDLIDRYAPAKVRDRILESRFYASLSTALAGSQEYIAMEKLGELREQRAESLLVLDTPPTAHALDFLEAPDRVLDFLDNEGARRLLRPVLAVGRTSLRLFDGTGFLTRGLVRLAGLETLRQLADFMVNLGSLNDDFRRRARSTRAMLTAPTTRFVLVTDARQERLKEVEHFLELLSTHRMTLAGIVVNGVVTPVEPAARAQAAQLTGTLAERVGAALDERDAQARLDAEGVARLARTAPDVPLVTVPRFDGDVHDLTTVAALARALGVTGAG